MTARKYSKQRESIKQFLMTRTDHPTADTVYLNIRQAFPNISLGTVYRNLNLLSEMGEIMKITTDGGADRFDGNTMRHSVPHSRCARRIRRREQPGSSGNSDSPEQKRDTVRPEALYLLSNRASYPKAESF